MFFLLFFFLTCLEFQEIGQGNFSRVYKVLKRIDGCLYAVKRSIHQLHQDSRRYIVVPVLLMQLLSISAESSFFVHFTSHGIQLILKRVKCLLIAPSIF